jgi:hypothetical protein
VVELPVLVDETMTVDELTVDELPVVEAVPPTQSNATWYRIGAAFIAFLFVTWTSMASRVLVPITPEGDSKQSEGTAKPKKSVAEENFE